MTRTRSGPARLAASRSGTRALAPLLTLAWRNVWRNRRRSAITTLSIAAGLAAILFAQSLTKTIQYQLVQKATRVFTGHIQILDKTVENHKFPEELIEDPAAVESAIRGVGNIAAYEKRILVTGLASTKQESLAVLVIGIEPEKDKRIMGMHEYLSEGSFLGAEPDGMYMGSEIARRLGLKVGDELVVMCSAVDGSMGAELFRVSGIFHTNSYTFDASIVYVPLEAAQSLLAADDRVNNFVFRIKDPALLRRTQEDLSRVLPGQPVQVLTWEEVDPELVGIRDYQDALLGIVLVVVFVIVALGILNTLLMSMFERIREFGVLMAIGARPGVIRRLVIVESCLMGLVGTLFGLVLGCGLIAYYGRTGLELPITDAVGYFMPFDTVLYLRFVWPTHLLALAAVFVTSVLSGVVPALRASSLRPAESLRHI